MKRHLASGFLASAAAFADRPAIEMGERSLSYRDVLAAAQRIATALQGAGDVPGPALTAVLGGRTPECLTAILGVLLSGHGYVPLNPSFPPRRTASMLARSECSRVVVSTDSIGVAPVLLQACPAVRTVVVAGEAADADLSALRDAAPGVTVLSGDELPDPSLWTEPVVSEDDPAYLLFTSGSTGVPKGVAVAQRNIRRFVDVVVERYSITEEDRFSQLFELVFDLSLFDLFAAWERGACVCLPAGMQALFPGRYVDEARLSVWFSVPSTAILVKRQRSLEPGAFPGLRVSLFCGEALPGAIAGAWARAAPGSVVENLYGPTEVTLACTLYRWREPESSDECEAGLTPIGAAFPGLGALVVDEDLCEVEPGATGELLMCGPQVALGYWRDPETTAQRFVQLAEEGPRYYRTGDLVRRPRASGAPIQYVGRVDHQVKLRGHRVELGEIEAALCTAAGVDVAVVLGWPLRDGKVDGFVGFVAAESVDATDLRARLGELLPGYMVPARIVALRNLPLNANGKVDRKALLRTLEENPNGRNG